MALPPARATDMGA